MRVVVSPHYDFVLPDGFEIVDPEQFDPTPDDDDDGELERRAASGQPLVSYMQGVLPPEQYAEAERITREAILQQRDVESQPETEPPERQMHPSLQRLQPLVDAGGSITTLQGGDGSALLFLGFPPDCPETLAEEVFERLDFRIKGGGPPCDEDGIPDIDGDWINDYDWDGNHPAVVDLEGEYGPFGGFETTIRQYRGPPMLWVVGLDPWPEDGDDGVVDGEEFWEWTYRRFADRLRSLRPRAG